MWSPFVIPPHPSVNCTVGFLETGKLLLPHALLFETAKEAFNQATLLGRIRRDRFLLESIVSAGLAEPSTLKDQAVITTKDWGRSTWSECAKASPTGALNGPFRFLRPSSQRQFIANNFPIMTINHRREMSLAIVPTGGMRDIHGPAIVTLQGSAPQGLARGSGV